MKESNKNACTICGKGETKKNELLKNDNGTYTCENCAAWYRPY